MKKIEAAELLLMYQYFLSGYDKPAGADMMHELLLYSHFKEMYIKVERMVLLGQRTRSKWCKLDMSRSEALAFYEFWIRTDTSAWPLGNAVVCEVLTDIGSKLSEPRLSRDTL